MRKNIIILFSFLILSLFLSPASAQPPSRLTISVMNLKSGSGINEGEALTLTDRLLVELVRTTRFEVTERARRDEVLKEVGFQQTGACDEASCLAQVGKYLGVQKMVGGSVGQIGKTYSVNLRMVDVETGRIEQTATKDYPGSIDYLLTTAMKEVAWQLARGGLTPKVQRELARRQKEAERLAAQRAADSLAAVRRAAAVAESLKLAEENRKQEQARKEAQRVADSLAAAQKAAFQAESLKLAEEAQRQSKTADSLGALAEAKRKAEFEGQRQEGEKGNAVPKEEGRIPSKNASFRRLPHYPSYSIAVCRGPGENGILNGIHISKMLSTLWEIEIWGDKQGSISYESTFGASLNFRFTKTNRIFSPYLSLGYGISFTKRQVSSFHQTYDTTTVQPGIVFIEGADLKIVGPLRLGVQAREGIDQNMSAFMGLIRFRF